MAYKWSSQIQFVLCVLFECIGLVYCWYGYNKYNFRVDNGRGFETSKSHGKITKLSTRISTRESRGNTGRLRLHPPFPLLIRESMEEVKLLDYHIPAKTQVLINAWAIGRDPLSWDDPEEYQPERFLNSDIDFRGPNFEMIPFGAGRRGCPGITFAIVIIELTLARFVHKFNFALPKGVKEEDLDMSECTGLTLRKKLPLLAVATPWSS